MDIEKFGEIMDDFLKDNHVIMQIEMPEGSDVPEVKDNTGCGPGIQFYMLLKAMPYMLDEMISVTGDLEVEGFLDGVLELVKKDVLDMRNKAEE